METVYKYGQQINYTIEKLSPDNGKLLGDFSCGNEVIDHYLYEDAIKDTSSICYVCIDSSSNEVIGFAALSCSGIHFEVDSMRKTIPAIQITYFAIDIKIQDLLYDDKDDHFYFSDMFLCDMIKMCRDITENYIGAEYIILYSVPDAKHFYERNMFEDYTQYMKSDRYAYLDDCVPMFMQL